MRKLLILLLLSGCAKSVVPEIDEPVQLIKVVNHTSIPDYDLHTTGRLAGAIFKGFPEFADYAVNDKLISVNDSTQYYKSIYDYSDVNFFSEYCIVQHNRSNVKPNTCINAYTYNYTSDIEPTLVFPPGNKYSKVGVVTNFTCADHGTCYGTQPYFDMRYGIIWGRDTLEVPYVEGQQYATVTWKKGAWYLTVNEILDEVGYVELNGIHLRGPGNRDVRVSHVRLDK